MRHHPSKTKVRLSSSHLCPGEYATTYRDKYFSQATGSNRDSHKEEIEEQIIGSFARRSPVLEDNIDEELVKSDDNIMLDDNADFHCRPKKDQVKLEEIIEEIFEKDTDDEQKEKIVEMDYVELKSYDVPYRRLRRPKSVL